MALESEEMAEKAEKRVSGLKMGIERFTPRQSKRDLRQSKLTLWQSK
jgi:hypothetical protein